MASPTKRETFGQGGAQARGQVAPEGSMSVLCSRLFLVAAFILTPVTLVAGFHSISEDPDPAYVVVEGVVVPGDAYSVDPLDDSLDAWDGTGLEASVKITNSRGEAAEVTSDPSGRFRVGPIQVSGHEDDMIMITCPRSRELCMSAFLPPEVHEARPGETVTVRWRVTLPPLRTSSRGA
jgi:hypothetical protein